MADFGSFLSNVALGAGQNIMYQQQEEGRQAQLADLKSQTQARKANSDLLQQDFMLRSGIAQRQAQAQEQKKKDLENIALGTEVTNAVENSPVETAQAEASMWEKRSSELWKKGYTAEAELASKESKRAADKAKEFGQIAKDQKASRVESLATAANDVLTAMSKGGLTPELAKAYYDARAQAGQPPSDKDYELDSPKGQTELILAAQKGADVRKLRESESRMEIASKRADETRQFHEDLIAARREAITQKAKTQSGVAIPDSIRTSKATGQEFMDLLAAEDQGTADLVKGVAENRIPISSVSTRGGHREKIISMVAQYKPDFDAKEYSTQSAGEKGFTTGRQGQAVASFNVAINHLSTLDKVARALDTSDSATLNKLQQSASREFGGADITNFESVKKIVADEIVKAVVGGGTTGGALADRKALEENIRAANSPAQLQGVITMYKELMRGQLEGKEKQYEAATGKKDFSERLLTKDAREEYSKSKSGSSEKQYPQGITTDSQKALYDRYNK